MIRHNSFSLRSPPQEESGSAHPHASILFQGAQNNAAFSRWKSRIVRFYLGKLYDRRAVRAHLFLLESERP